MDTEIKNAVNATDKDADEINVSRVRTGKGSA